MLMNEYSLHSEIKNGYSLLGHKLEVKVDDFIADIVRNAFLLKWKLGIFLLSRRFIAKQYGCFIRIIKG